MTAPGQLIEWQRHPDVEVFAAACLDELAGAMPVVRRLQARWMAQSSTRLIDWIDHFILADGDAPRGRLAELGFAPEDAPAPPGETVYHHPGAVVPRVVLRPTTDAAPGTVLAAALGVEDVAAFLTAQGVASAIEGAPLSPYRRAEVWAQGARAILAVERRGGRGFVPVEMPPDFAVRYLRAAERWATRPRRVENLRAGMEAALRLARDLVSELGADVAAWVAFSAERDYWQQRNRAGSVQSRRQEVLGVGWANHDHHTFRSSRAVFPLLIQILETFGFQPRERFYAGAEAGWGAQVMEQPTCRLVVFADVDLAPHEVESDFAHVVLAPRSELGTVGLWCALHSESMLAAGLHHLAGRFDFDAVTAALADERVPMMHPFSDFTYLRQAFTQGERWPVSADRLERLYTLGQIDAGQRARLAEEGAIGSHLEDIQRGEGFKGFNQRNVSDIIRRTDPRRASGKD